MAASNSAEVEKLALGAGMKKGGAAKGELVLAMYELANCFRNGWGIKKDPAAAKQYYETAANLGDTDAMNEVAWCYTEGFGTKKDKVCQLTIFSFVYQVRCPPFLRPSTSTSPVDVDSSKLFMRRELRTVEASLGRQAMRMSCPSRQQTKCFPLFFFPLPSPSASLFGQQHVTHVRLLRYRFANQ
jgi:TPR repeat protein